ncbi:hypothetical protein OIU84_019834 [Salix udensis]|uniref:Uncharacterized protein n=1 Tax=Salix udensis TaxID=889485 RepID=A0AAD6KZS0_9ROSI|nr:hypothetical protein OIU84_019834 [Salix udensis]
MATSAVMQSVPATPVASSLVKNQSRVCHLFPATYGPPRRGGSTKRVQCKAEPDVQKNSAERKSTRDRKDIERREPHGSSEQVSSPPSRL